MNFVNYYMPTKILLDENVVLKTSNLFNTFGNKALIVTGKTSSAINGSLKDVTEALNNKGLNNMIGHIDSISSTEICS